jgi:hypothetical protein
MAMAPRIIMRIELTPAAKEQLERSCETMGTTQVAMLSRVVEWYASQPEVIQRIIVGHVPAALESDVARLVLQNLLKSKKSASSRSALAALP